MAPLVTMLQWLGEDEDALALLGPYLPGEPVTAAIAARVYRRRGGEAAAACVLQHVLLCAALEAAADVQALAALYGDEPGRLAEVAAVAEGLAAVPGMTVLAPTLLPMIRRALAASLRPAIIVLAVQLAAWARAFHEPWSLPGAFELAVAAEEQLFRSLGILLLPRGALAWLPAAPGLRNGGPLCKSERLCTRRARAKVPGFAFVRQNPRSPMAAGALSASIAR